MSFSDDPHTGRPRQIQDSQDQILVMAFGYKSFKPFNLLCPHSAAVQGLVVNTACSGEHIEVYL